MRLPPIWLSAVASIVVAALAAVGCGDGEEEGRAAEDGEPELTDIIASPGEYERVTVTGRAAPLGPQGFVLDDGTAEIIVLARRTPSQKVDPGEVVEVDAAVGELSHAQLELLMIDLSDAAAERPGEVVPEALGEAPVEVGAPYLDLRSLGGEDAD
jgi:hypothetical protein